MNEKDVLVQLTRKDYENMRERAIKIARCQTDENPDLYAPMITEASLIRTEDFENPATMKAILSDLNKLLVGIIYLIDKDDEGNFIYNPADVDYSETRKCWEKIFREHVEILNEE